MYVFTLSMLTVCKHYS